MAQFLKGSDHLFFNTEQQNKLWRTLLTGYPITMTNVIHVFANANRQDKMLILE